MTREEIKVFVLCAVVAFAITYTIWLLYTGDLLDD